MTPKPTTEPTVELTPPVKVGDTVIHNGELTEHTILAITPEGNLQLTGCACLTAPTAVTKKA